MASTFKAGVNPFDVQSTLFKSTDNSAKVVSGESNSTIEISKLKPFSKHPFKMYSGEKMQSLSKSIKENGVISPILVRPIIDEKYEYEIIAGHNRVQACRIAGIDEVPAMVKELTDEVATVLMVDSNLEQRDDILPSEKAFAYKYKLEAIKAQGKRTDLTSVQVAQKLDNSLSRDALAKENHESGDTVRRYIRLTYLVPELLEKVDEKKLSFIPAVDLSSLKENEQKHLLDILTREESFAVSGKQASTLKAMSATKALSYEDIDKVITAKVSSAVSSFKVSYKKVAVFFDKTVTPREFEETVVKALEMYFEHEQNFGMEI